MNDELFWFTWFLSLIWFVLYWIFGGVFFAVVAFLRFGRVRKVRFSCLFSLWTILVAAGAAWGGMLFAQEAQTECLLAAETKAEAITAVFGCGAIGVFGALLVGVAVLVIGGFLIMAISRTDNKPWIKMENDEEEKEVNVKEKGSSRFFR